MLSCHCNMHSNRSNILQQRKPLPCTQISIEVASEWIEVWTYSKKPSAAAVAALEKLGWDRPMPKTDVGVKAAIELRREEIAVEHRAKRNKPSDVQLGMLRSAGVSKIPSTKEEARKLINKLILAGVIEG